MLRLYREGVSVLAVLDSRRAKKSGEYPVKIEVVHNRVQKYYPTGVDMSSSAWKGLSCSRKLPDRHSEIIRQFNRVATEVQSMIDRGSFSMEALDVRLGKTAPLTVDMSLKTMMDNMLKEGRVNSYYRCRSTLKAVARFCPGEITFQMMTPAWFSAFENFLRTENKTVTTINIYMKTLRTVLNEALKEGFIRRLSFRPRTLRDTGCNLPQHGPHRGQSPQGDVLQRPCQSREIPRPLALFLLLQRNKFQGYAIP